MSDLSQTPTEVLALLLADTQEQLSINERIARSGTPRAARAATREAERLRKRLAAINAELSRRQKDETQ